MAELTVGQEIKILVPLTITKIGTCDLEVEYSAGSINKKLYIPKNICEPVLVTEIIAGSFVTHPIIPQEYKCEVCGKVLSKKIALAGHMRSHKPKGA